MMRTRRLAGRPSRAAWWGLAVLLAVAPIRVTAEESIHVAGSVVDGSGAAIPGAAVLLRNAETGFERLAAADSRGQFDFEGLSAGRYRLSGQARGFARAER